MEEQKCRDELPYVARPIWIDRRIESDFRRCKKRQRKEFEKLRQLAVAAAELAAPNSARRRNWFLFWLYVGVLRQVRIGPKSLLYPVKIEMEGYIFPPEKLRTCGLFTLPVTYFETSLRILGRMLLPLSLRGAGRGIDSGLSEFNKDDSHSNDSIDEDLELPDEGGDRWEGCDTEE